MKAAFLGIDLGSTALKVVVSDGISRIHASTHIAVTIDRPHPGWAEQSPERWWKALVRACKALKLRDKNICGVSFSGQMHGAVVLDRNDCVLRPAILWNDQRAVQEAQRLARQAPHLANTGGVKAMASFVAPKLLWIKRHEPDVFSRVDCVLAPKDYLRLQMTGVRASDPVDGCGMWLLDAARRAWSPELAELSGISLASLPPVLEATTQAGSLQPAAAQALGLTAGIPIITGTGDAAASAIGLGIIKDGEGVVSMGTAAQIIVVKDRHSPNPDKAIHAYCFGLPGMWFQMAALLDGASPLAWMTRLFGEKDPSRLLKEVERKLKTSTHEPSRILALPYLSGIRTPHDDPMMRGAFVGLDHTTDRADLVRAMLEGVALSLADCHRCLEDMGSRPRSLLIVGGGAKSTVWTQMIANALGRSLTRAEASEFGAALGAARLARIGVTGEALEHICVSPQQQEPIRPNAVQAKFYAERLDTFRQLYGAIRDMQ
jgi:xylulokinase